MNIFVSKWLLGGVEKEREREKERESFVIIMLPKSVDLNLGLTWG